MTDTTWVIVAYATSAAALLGYGLRITLAIHRLDRLNRQRSTES